jgi:hypothetical protein
VSLPSVLKLLVQFQTDLYCNTLIYVASFFGLLIIGYVVGLKDGENSHFA